MENNIHIPIQELERRFKSVLVRLPILAGNEAVNFILDNFKKQGFLGDTFEPWRQRKNPTKWGQAPKRNGRALLVDSGRLRRSWRVVSVSAERVVIGSDAPYAKAHNEGLSLGLIQNVKAHSRKVNGISQVSSIKTKKTRNVKVQVGEINVAEHTRRINQKIPRRRMIGKSTYLDNRIKRIITAELMKALK